MRSAVRPQARTSEARGTGEIFVENSYTGSAGDGQAVRVMANWGEWVPAGASAAQGQPGAPVTAAWERKGERTDLFVTNAYGTVLTTNRTVDFGWQPWSEIGKSVLFPGTEVSAVWRGTRAVHLDLFAGGADGTVMSTWWDRDGGWRQWFPIPGDRQVFPGATVTAVWREGGTDHLDLFTTGIDGTVMSTFWEGEGGWRQWFPVQGDTKVAPGTAVTALWRPGHSHIDLFASGSDGLVQSTYWEPGIGWQPWFAVDKRPGVASSTAAVAAVWRSPDHLDLLTIGPDSVRRQGTVRSATWEPTTGWQEWYDVRPDSGHAYLGCHATVTAGKITPEGVAYTDAFMTSWDGTVLVTYSSSGTDWHDWIQVRPETKLYPGAAVAAVWRDAERAEQVDLFVSGIDGTVLTNRWTS